MKQIITIRLGHYLLSADDDAAAMIAAYTESLRRKYQNEEGGAEIIGDIEERIGELLQARQQEFNRNFTTVEDTRFVLDQMGPVEEGETARESQDGQSTRKRLFRDEENGMIGGVCAGLAEYFNVDVVIIRILFVVTFIAFGFGLPAYIIFWAVTPVAKTAADRLMMKGQAPTLQNIEDNVKQEFSKVEDRLRRNGSGFTRQVLRPLFRIAVRFVVLVAKFIGWMVASAFAMAFIALLVAISTDAAEMTFPNMQINGAKGVNDLFSIPWGEPLLTKALFVAFLLGCLISITLLMVGQQGRRNPEIRKARTFLAWFNTILLFAVITTIIAGFSTLGRPAFRDLEKEKLTVTGDTLWLSTYGRPGDQEGMWMLNELDEIRVSPDTAFYVEASVTGYKSHENSARKNAQVIPRPWKTEKNRLLLEESRPYRINGRGTPGYANIILYVPKGKTVKTEKTFVFHRNNHSDLDGPLSTFSLDSSGRVLSSAHATVMGTGEDIRTLRVSGPVDVKIVQSAETRIELVSGPILRHQEWIENDAGHLEIEAHGHLDGSARSVVRLHVRDLESAEAIATGRISFLDWQGSGLNIRATGAGQIQGKFKLERLNLELEGASECTARGSASLIKGHVEGASTLQALELECKDAEMDVTGASSARIWATRSAEGDVQGASKMQLKGNPGKTRLNSSGASEIDRI